MNINEITEKIIGAAITVHRALGPGLLESAYEACFVIELKKRELRVEQQKPIPVTYGDIQIACAYRLDLLVEGQVIIEIKAVAKLEKIHTAQMLTYLRLTGSPIGLIFNFNEEILSRGIRRVVLGLPKTSELAQTPR